MKKTVLSGILLLVVVLMIPAAGAGTGGMERAYPENDTEGYVPVDIIIIDPVIKAASPDHAFLVLDAEGKKNYLDALSADIDILYATDLKKEEKKAGLVARLNAIWEKYPVVSDTKPGGTGYPAYGGSETTIRFVPSITSTRLTDNENAAIRESAAIMTEAYKKGIGNPAAEPSDATAPAAQRTRSNDNTSARDGTSTTLPASIPAILIPGSILCGLFLFALRCRK